MAAQVRRVLFQVSLVAFLALALGVGQAAHASIIAYEGFDYTQAVGTSLNGLSGGANETGWGGAWTTVGYIQWGNLSSELANQMTFAGYAASGKAAQVTFWGYNDDAKTPVTAAYRPSNQTVTGTMYVSFLAQCTGGAGSNAWGRTMVKASSVSTGMNDSNQYGFVSEAETARTLSIMLHDSSWSDYNTTAVSMDGANTSSNPNNGSGQDALLYVARITNLGGGGDQLEKLWVLTATNYGALTTKDEADLGAHCVTTATNTVTGKTFANYYLELGGKGGNDSGFALIVDEIKYGTDSVSVLSAVPEPATMALLGLGAVAMLVKRRRK